MKHLTLVAIFLLFPVSVNAETLWEKYLWLPTPENASKVEKIEYSEGSIPENYGYWYPDLLVMKNQILGGDKESFRLAFRIKQSTNGAALIEHINDILGSVIRSNPELFLQEIKYINPSTYSLKSVLKMTGDEYVDRMEAVKYEWKMRAEALSTVTAPDLEATKQKCLELLEN